MSIKKLIRGFYRKVHPDLLGEAPTIAIECNSKSLQELNAYIDRLESPENVPGPYVARKVQFFRHQVNRKGDSIPGLMKSCMISLESIPPFADMLEKEDISVRLVREIENALEDQPVFSSKSVESLKIEPIIKTRAESASSMQEELSKIWEDEALNDRIRTSIFHSVEERIERYRNYHAILAYNKLVKKYTKIKNYKRRKKRMDGIEEEVGNIIKDKKIPSVLDSVEVSSQEEDESKVRVIEAGYHPDLVFFDRDLSKEEQEEGISRICGINLSQESDLWLLENLWKAVRHERPPSVPIVLSHQYQANTEGGHLRIPFNFILEELVEFLEENLESVRTARKELISRYAAV